MCCGLFSRSTKFCAKGIYLLVIWFPSFICKCTPNAHWLLSLGFLYIFTQSMGLLWAVLVNLISVTSMNLAHWFADHENPIEYSMWSIFEAGVKVYIRFTLFRIGFLIGHSLWKIGWEGYSHFPSVLSLVNVRAKALPPSQRAMLRHTILKVPLRILLFFSSIMIGVQNKSTYILAKALAPDNWFLYHMGDVTSRFNRITRFTVLIALLQWVQQFYLLYVKTLLKNLPETCTRTIITMFPPLLGTQTGLRGWRSRRSMCYPDAVSCC